MSENKNRLKTLKNTKNQVVNLLLLNTVEYSYLYISVFVRPNLCLCCVVVVRSVV